MSEILQDVRVAYRGLIKRPGFALIVVLSLAFSIGATTAIFGVVNAVALRPLPYADSERLVLLLQSLPQAGMDEIPVSAPDFLDFREQQQVFESMAAYRTESFELSGSGEPERVVGARVSPSLFPLLGSSPVLGRGFNASEEQPGRDNVLVLSHGFWQRRFAGDSGVLGQRITLNRTPHTVVGVMPANFSFPPAGPRWNNQPADLWVPMAFTAADLENRGGGFNKSVLARLKEGVSVTQASSRADELVRRIFDEKYPAALRNSPTFELRAMVVPFHQEVVGRVTRPLLLLLGAVGLVLLVTYADVGNLILSRASSRSREFAVRVSLGARPLRLFKMFLAESALLALLGGGLGLLLAWAASRVLPLLVSSDLPRVGEIGLDPTVTAFVLLLCIFTTVFFSMFPLLGAVRRNLHESLKERSSSQLPGGGRRNWTQKALVISTVALAFVLLIGAGLLIRSFTHLIETDPGFRPQQLLTLSVPLAAEAYPEADQIRAFYQRLLGKIENLPGVRAVGASNDLPLQGTEVLSFWPEGRAAENLSSPPLASHSWVLQDYFEAVGIELKQGRYFGPQDRQDSDKVVIVSETLAERIWPGQNPIGQRIKWGVAESGWPWMSVVGVVKDVKEGPLHDDASPHTYQPFLQVPDFLVADTASGQLRSLNFAIRTEGDPTSLIAAVRGQIRKLDPNLAVTDVNTMEQKLSESLAARRLMLRLVGGFAVIALLLAAFGLYGVLAYSVARRTYEIGIRKALGAQRGDLLKLVIRQGMSLVVVGIGIGLIVALASNPLLSGQLYRVKSTDPLTFAAVLLVLLTVALLACYLPGRRAAKVDSIIALKSD
ncbi:MAG TPA: ABC transporter permease [Acidobacteriota bacterium]|nr:ABC transporter permease [Acidobacteriota bacterium]